MYALMVEQDRHELEIQSSPLRADWLMLGTLAAVLADGCGETPSKTGCTVSGNLIVCVGESFDDCAAAGCSIGDLNCQKPPLGCEIAPATTLAHYAEKPPNDFYLCDEAGSDCGTWTEAGCQVTVTPDSGPPIDYTIQDPTCP
jgi:hypothetical protein